MNNNTPTIYNKILIFHGFFKLANDGTESCFYLEPKVWYIVLNSYKNIDGLGKSKIVFYKMKT